jgi:hypothetical protein
MDSIISPAAETAARPLASGFKVDVSRGERIGCVSSEWFSRPDDGIPPASAACTRRGRSSDDRGKCGHADGVH